MPKAPGLVRANEPSATQAPLESDPSDGFDEAIAEVDALEAAQDWEGARDRLRRLLRESEGDPRLALHRREFVENFARFAYRSSRGRPRFEELFPGAVESFHPRTLEVRLRYRDLGWSDWVAAPRSWREDWRAPQLRAHPVLFEGPHRVDVFGIAGEGGELATLYLGVDGGEATRIRTEGGADRSLEVTATRVGPREAESLSRETSRTLVPGSSAHWRVDLGRSDLRVSLENRRVLRLQRPDEPRGRVAVEGVGTTRVTEIRLGGRVDATWLENQLDRVDRERWETFRRNFDAEEDLPPSLRSSAFFVPADFTVEGRGYPGVSRPERGHVLQTTLEHIAKDRGEEVLEHLDGLDPEIFDGAFRDWMRVLVHLDANRREACLGAARRVVEGDPDFAPARDLLGEMLLRAHRLQEARDVFARQVEDGVPTAFAFLRWASAELMLGRREACRDVMLAALEAGLYSRELDRVNATLSKSMQGPLWDERFEFESEHYRVVSDIDGPLCRRVATDLERSLHRFQTRFGPVPGEADRFQVFVFRTETGYQNYVEDILGGRRENTAGLYSPQLQQLLLWQLSDERLLEMTTRHEAFHQYLHWIVRDPPVWLNEGLAEAWEVASRGRGPRTPFPLNSEHLELLATPIASTVDLDTLLHMDARRFYAKASTNYALAWSFVHFLLEGPKERRPLLDQILLRLRDGEDGHGAVDAVLGAVDLEVLEAEWREHYRAFE